MDYNKAIKLINNISDEYQIKNITVGDYDEETNYHVLSKDITNLTNDDNINDKKICEVVISPNNNMLYIVNLFTQESTYTIHKGFKNVYLTYKIKDSIKIPFD